MDIATTRSNSLKGLAIDSLAITSSAQFVFLENGMANGITFSRDAEKARFLRDQKEKSKKKNCLYLYRRKRKAKRTYKNYTFIMNAVVRCIKEIKSLTVNFLFIQSLLLTILVTELCYCFCFAINNLYATYIGDQNRFAGIKQ